MGVRGSPWPNVIGSYYLNFNSGDLTNTSCHMCGSWYLPIFLFRDGSFTLINIASSGWSSICQFAVRRLVTRVARSCLIQPLLRQYRRHSISIHAKCNWYGKFYHTEKVRAVYIKDVPSTQGLKGEVLCPHCMKVFNIAKTYRKQRTECR